MGVSTGHGDSQCPAIWKGSLLLLGKLRPGVSQKLIGVAVLLSQNQLEWPLEIKLVLGMYNPPLASGGSVLLYLFPKSVCLVGQYRKPLFWVGSWLLASLPTTTHRGMPTAIMCAAQKASP